MDEKVCGAKVTGSRKSRSISSLAVPEDQGNGKREGTPLRGGPLDKGPGHPTFGPGVGKGGDEGDHGVSGNGHGRNDPGRGPMGAKPLIDDHFGQEGPYQGQHPKGPKGRILHGDKPPGPVTQRPQGVSPVGHSVQMKPPGEQDLQPKEEDGRAPGPGRRNETLPRGGGGPKKRTQEGTHHGKPGQGGRP